MLLKLESLANTIGQVTITAWCKQFLWNILFLDAVKLGFVDSSIKQNRNEPDSKAEGRILRIGAYSFTMSVP